MNRAAEDWKITPRRSAEGNPEYRAELMKVIAELLTTGDDEDREVAYILARGILDLEFDTPAELAALVEEPIPADVA